MVPTSSNKRLVRKDTTKPKNEPTRAGGDSRAIANKIKSPLKKIIGFSITFLGRIIFFKKYD